MGTPRSQARLLCLPAKPTSPHPDLTLMYASSTSSDFLPAFRFPHQPGQATSRRSNKQPLTSQQLPPAMLLVHVTHHVCAGGESLPIKVVPEEFRQPPAGDCAKGKTVPESLALTMKRSRLEVTAIIPH